MAYWLFKSEPTTWSFTEQEEKKITNWDGVRNHQACNYMKQMKLDDLGFFYHSNIGKEIVGIIRIIQTYHPDPSDVSGRFGMVSVTFERKLTHPISLTSIKQNPKLTDLHLIKQPRLSVMPVTENDWNTILGMSTT